MPRRTSVFRNQTRLASLDLQREVLRVDARLGEAAGDEPQSRLPSAREHVAQLLVFAESLLLVGSTALVAATPPLILLTESGGLRGGLDVAGLLRLLRRRGRESAASGLMSLLCLDIISPFGLLACGIGLVASTPYAYAVLAATAVAYDRKVRR